MQLNGSDLVGLPLMSTAHKILTGILLRLPRISNPLLLGIIESERDFQIKYSTNIRNGIFNTS